MARIKEASVREVVAAADMVEVVSGRTSLRKAGARYSGRCPFHEERTPSFSVNPADKLYHCFGCGKGGDVITFVRETESLDFAGAVEWLAERFRVTLEYEETSPQLEESRKRRDRLHAVLDQAASFYERHLWESAAGAPVRAYLESRGLGEAVCREFRLGLSPGSGLAAKAQEKGFTRDELRGAGLTNARGNDYFPPRLMFPLADARGRIVGFQARKLREDDPLRGKYVNSPEGELFHKSAILYGLHLARTAIAKQERGVVVEGNTDVIALRQAGLRAGRRLDGDGADRAPAEGAAAADAAPLPLLRLRRGRGGGDAARDGARDVARLRRARRDAAEGPGSGRRAGRLRGAARRGGELRRLPRPARARPHAGPAGGVRPRPRDPAAERGLAGVAGRAAPARGPAEPAEGDARGPDAEGRRPDAHRGALAEACSRRATGSSGTRSPPASRIPRSSSCSPSSPPSTSTPSCTAASARISSTAASSTSELLALRAELDARAAREGLDERTGKELLLNLRERRLRRELAHAEFDQMKELQTQLARVQDAILELA